MIMFAAWESPKANAKFDTLPYKLIILFTTKVLKFSLILLSM